MRPYDAHIDDEITAKRPVIPSRVSTDRRPIHRRERKWLTHLGKTFYGTLEWLLYPLYGLRARHWVRRKWVWWLEQSLLAIQEHKPVSDYLQDIVITVQQEPKECDFCPFGQGMLAITNGWKCPRCGVSYYLPVSLTPSVLNKPSITSPVTPLPSTRAVGDLPRLYKQGYINLKGPISLSGLHRLQWYDGSRVDTGQLPRIQKTIKKTHLERTDQ